MERYHGAQRYPSPKSSTGMYHTTGRGTRMPSQVGSGMAVPPPPPIGSGMSYQTGSGMSMSYQTRSGIMAMPPPALNAMNIPPPALTAMNIPPPALNTMNIPPPRGNTMNIPPPTGNAMNIPPPTGNAMNIPPPKGMNIPPPTGNAMTIPPPTTGSGIHSRIEKDSQYQKVYYQTRQGSYYQNTQGSYHQNQQGSYHQHPQGSYQQTSPVLYHETQQTSYQQLQQGSQHQNQELLEEDDTYYSDNMPFHGEDDEEEEDESDMEDEDDFTNEPQLMSMPDGPSTSQQHQQQQRQEVPFYVAAPLRKRHKKRCKIPEHRYYFTKVLGAVTSAGNKGITFDGILNHVKQKHEEVNAMEPRALVRELQKAINSGIYDSFHFLYDENTGRFTVRDNKKRKRQMLSTHKREKNEKKMRNKQLRMLGLQGPTFCISEAEALADPHMAAMLQQQIPLTPGMSAPEKHLLQLYKSQPRPKLKRRGKKMLNKQHGLFTKDQYVPWILDAIEHIAPDADKQGVTWTDLGQYIVTKHTITQPFQAFCSTLNVCIKYLVRTQMLQKARGLIAKGRMWGVEGDALHSKLKKNPLKKLRLSERKMRRIGQSLAS